MKTILTQILPTFIGSLLCLSIHAQSFNIPDTNFKDALLAHGIDTDSDNEISRTEAYNFTGTLDLQSSNINDLTGIEFFSNITGLDCTFNNLTSLDISANTKLQKLWCAYNQINQLDLSYNPELTILHCKGNQLKTLDLSNQQDLTLINCAENQLEELSTRANFNVTDINCSSNQLGRLDLASGTNLVSLDCSNNKLSHLNLDNRTGLQTLSCNDNQITSLDLNHAVQLRDIDCSNNKIQDLVISELFLLETLFLTNNQLETLNISNSLPLVFSTENNPNLYCIQVSSYIINDIPASWRKDDTADYSTDCSALTTSNNEIAEQSISIYPNPVKDILNIEINSEQAVQIALYNQLGVQIAKITEQKVDMSSYTSGIYYITMQNEAGQIIKQERVVVDK